MFVRSVFNSGERAGGAICGFWRASLLVIIFPGVILDETKAHCCIITRCRLGFPIVECVLWGNNSMMGLRKTIVVDFFTDSSMKKLAPRTMLGFAPHIVWLQSSLRQEEDFRHFFSSQMSGSCQKLGEDGERHFLHTNRKSFSQNNGQRKMKSS